MEFYPKEKDMNIKSIFKILPKMRFVYYKFFLANQSRKNLYLTLLWLIFALTILCSIGLGIFNVHLDRTSQMYSQKNGYTTYMISVLIYLLLSSFMWGWCLIEIWLFKKGHYDK